MVLLGGKAWALVTGASSGMGPVIALALAKEGCCVALAARSKEKMELVAAQCKAAGAPEVEVLPCDLSDSAAVTSLAEGLISRHDGVEILINSAGNMINGNPLDGDPDKWEQMMALNVNAPMRLTRLLSPKMAERMSGCIINIGSIAAIEAMSGDGGAYAAAKHALRGWSLSSYLTLRHKNVKCVLINPAFVNTPLVSLPEEKIDREKMLQPEDIAMACMFVLKSSPACVPEEMNLRLTVTPFK